MGISTGGARLLLEEINLRPVARGSVILQLGRQHLFIEKSEFEALASLHMVDLSYEFADRNKRPALLDARFIDDGTFFSTLGFSDVESVDYSSDENPTHVHDLNTALPQFMRERYDMVYDGGTIEHVFDVRCSLRNIFEALKVGGRIVHSSPSSNHVDHGFYMFSPTFFYDYYTINKFIIREIKLFTYTKDHNVDPWMIYDYVPGCLDHLSFGGFEGNRLLGVFVSAEKTAESTWDRIPQQAMYARRWSDYAVDELMIEQPLRVLNATLKPDPPAPPIVRKPLPFLKGIVKALSGKV